MNTKSACDPALFLARLQAVLMTNTLYYSFFMSPDKRFLAMSWLMYILQIVKNPWLAFQNNFLDTF